MFDLRQYYLNNIKEEDYYYRFYAIVKDVDIISSSGLPVPKVKREKIQFLVYDKQDAMDKFKELCQPGQKFDDNEKKCWFYIVCYYLNRCEVYIEQFPNILKRPPENPSTFTYNEIRNWAIAHRLDNNGTVQYITRRKIVSEFKFLNTQSYIEPGEDIESLFNKISTNSIDFQNLSIESKLREIANLIEHLLKINGKFEVLNYERITFGYITNENIKDFRKQIQCFRHATEKALAERKRFTERQKSFLVDYGLTLSKVIFNLRKYKERENNDELHKYE